MSKQPTPPQDSSLYAQASNDTGTKTTFRQRQRYEFLSYAKLGSFINFDFWGRDKDYGRIDNDGNAIITDESRLQQLRYADGPVFAVDFVAQAWRDYAEKMRSLTQAGQLYKQSPYADPKVKKGWTSVRVQYEEYLNTTVYPAFLSFLTAPLERKIIDFPSFLSVFADFASVAIGKSGPITMAGFVESLFCSPLNTGLVVEIGDDSHAADLPKVKKYLMDKNYPVACNVASQYGFAFDKNAPWRLVANVSSAAMQEYMVGVFLLPQFKDSRNKLDDCDEPILTPPVPEADPYGYSAIPGFESVLRHAPGFDDYSELFADYPLGASDTRGYRIVCQRAGDEVWKTDMDDLKLSLLNFYNTYARKNPVTTVYRPEFINCDGSHTDIIERDTAPPEIVDQQTGRFGDRWNLRTYYNLRSLEKSINKDPAAATRDLKNIMTLYNMSSGNEDFKYLRAMRQVQNLVGKTATRDPNLFTYATLGDIL